MIAELDPIEAIPEPDILRQMLADTIRKRELLESLLRVSVRKANWRPRRPSTASVPITRTQSTTVEN